METYVSTNKEQLDITKIHRYISEDSYWGMKRSLEDVQKDSQGKGLGYKLISHVMNSDALIEIKTFALKTKDAHSLYERFGFEKIGNSTLWMTKDNVVL